MKTIQEILQLSTEYLAKKKLENPRHQAELLISLALQLSRMDLYMQFDRPLDEQEVSLIRKNLQRRGEGEPWQYIYGEVEFYGCRITVTPDVLIPRQETEILVDKIVSLLRKSDISQKKLWDMCTGSGCIGIAIKKAIPELHVTLSDISEKSMVIAQENARKNDVNVSFCLGDLFKPFAGEKADFIVCNPPYISDMEFQSLSQEVKNYEPKMALLAGKTGVEFYQKMANSLKHYVSPAAKIWFEIGHTQGPLVLEIFSSQGFRRCAVEKDWAGHDRFFSLENE